MTTVRAYVRQMRRRVGVWTPPGYTGATRTFGELDLLAVVVKVLVDKGVITDAELLAAMDQATGASHGDDEDGP